jgi:hypothetical protein
MLRLSRLVWFVLVFLGLLFCFCLSYPWLNPALATGPMGQYTRNKAIDLTVEPPTITDPPLLVAANYGRLSENYIVNRGQVDERVQINIEGGKQTTISNLEQKGGQEVSSPIQNILLRPFIQGEDGKSKAGYGEIPDAILKGTNVVAGYVATVTGPGELSFSWKVSCEPLVAHLELRLDGEQVSEISGEIDWHQKTIAIPEGSHTLGWLYCKDCDSSSGADCGWLDQVEFTATHALDNR